MANGFGGHGASWNDGFEAGLMRAISIAMREGSEKVASAIQKELDRR